MCAFTKGTCARENPLLRDREMAALAAGVQYGLSSHSNFHKNKSLIFVKLTDSAQRAIEDFLRNRVSKSYSYFVPFFAISFPYVQARNCELVCVYMYVYTCRRVCTYTALHASRSSHVCVHVS